MQNENLLIHDADNYVIIKRNWQTPSAELLQELEELPLQQRQNTLYGKTFTQKRLQCGFGDVDVKVQPYSNVKIPLASWIPEIERLRDRIVTESHLYLDACLINYYRNGEDYIDKHSDKEAFGISNAVFTYSVGASRKFRFYTKPTQDTNARMVAETVLHDGDLCIMIGSQIQKCYNHTIPIEKKVTTARYSLTFRLLCPEYLANQDIFIKDSHYDFSKSRYA